jgi:uncharacterized protein YvpB
MTRQQQGANSESGMGCGRWLFLLILFFGSILVLMGLYFIVVSEAPLDALAVAEIDTPLTTFTSPPQATPTDLPEPTQTASVAVTEVILATETATNLPTPTRRYGTATPSRTPPPVPTRFVSPTPGGSARIEGLVGRRQSLPLSCEASAAIDWAAYFGVQIDELEFFSHIPASDNPDKGFVGDVNGAWGQIPPAPYGVYAAPVALVLRTYGLPALARSGMSWGEIQAEISAGRPVIVWVTGHVVKGTPVPYVASDGESTVVTRFQHTVMVTGYADDQVWILDGAQEYTRTLKMFLDSWGVLGNMGIVWRE